MGKNICAMYFSATGTTKRTITAVAGAIAADMDEDLKISVIDFTLPTARKNSISFSKDDLVILGIPVIAGRVPNLLVKYLRSISGNGALAVAVVLYGNRNYDDALIELRDLLVTDGFQVIAAGAFIGEHSFSRILAKDRPDEEDVGLAKELGKLVSKKLCSCKDTESIDVKGNRPYGDYYKPRNKAGEPVDIRKVIPKTNENCNFCNLCVDLCPLGSIDPTDVTRMTGICMKCCACIKACPMEARYFDDKDFLRHKYELEVDFAERKQPEIFI